MSDEEARNDEEALKVIASYRQSKAMLDRQSHTDSLRATIQFQNGRMAEIASLLECDVEHVIPAVQSIQRELTERTSEVYDLKAERKQ